MGVLSTNMADLLTINITDDLSVDITDLLELKDFIGEPTKRIYNHYKTIWFGSFLILALYFLN